MNATKQSLSFLMLQSGGGLLRVFFSSMSSWSGPPENVEDEDAHCLRSHVFSLSVVVWSCENASGCRHCEALFCEG